MLTEPAPDVVAHKSALFSAAYHLLGDVADAEDVVQDCYVTWFSGPRHGVANPRAYLMRMVVNRATDRLRQRQRERAHYVGPWLPAPITDDTDCGLTEAERAELLPYALLVTLETLTPAERAVFILREAFNYAYADIAELCQLSQANCRQLRHRAGQKLQQPSARRPNVVDELDQHASDPLRRTGRTSERRTSDRRTALLKAFLAACQHENPDELARLLSADIVLTTDGGGKVTAARKPLAGAPAVIRFILGLMKQSALYELALTHVNGEPAFRVISRATGRTDTVFTLATHNGQITQLFAVRNPDKLTP